MTNMYDGFKTSPSYYVGCLFDCTYCDKSFKAQMKRQRFRCMDCYNYVPHTHLRRLSQPLGYNRYFFLCAFGDTAFADTYSLHAIFKKVRDNPTNTFLLQSKGPETFNRFSNFPDNMILGTTLETNRDTRQFSKAPLPEKRYKALKGIAHSRKAVTVEPAMKSDRRQLVDWINELEAEIIWVGLDNHNCGLPEPTLEELENLIEDLQKSNPDVRTKTLR